MAKEGRAASGKKKPIRVGRRALSSQEKMAKKIKNDHRTLVRKVFERTGFKRFPEISDKEFTFKNQASDFDDVFVYENIVVLLEYTSAQSSNVGGHLRVKKIVYDNIFDDPKAFLKLLETKFLKDRSIIGQYHYDTAIIKILYCSRYNFDESHKTNVLGPIYFDYSIVRYFDIVAKTIERSALYEFLNFLCVDLTDVGSNGAVPTTEQSTTFHGSILPEAYSNFDDGYKIVSFYADANTLLKTCYVLRKDGWRDSSNLYQRMISSKKIKEIRHYLKKQKRVFINNIIVTLPNDVSPVNEKGQTFDANKLTKTAPVIIKIPNRANSIGIIDGQHRVFAYHETNPDDREIAERRSQQNLLVTGIVYPEELQEVNREEFEAKLFLEINSNQTSAKADLKQAIGLVIEPFSSDSIATRVLKGLSEKGPLATFMEQNFYDIGKLKTSSIVSFGLKPLVKMSGTDSIYAVWDLENKDKVVSEKNHEALSDYIKLSVSKINIVLGSIKDNIDRARWTIDKNIENRVISTTSINCFLIVVRTLIQRQEILDYETLKEKFSGIDKFNFYEYRSSQYNRMADEIVKNFFGH